jgi:hypothetical protein
MLRRPVRGDLVLNPLDARCPIWPPWWELKPGSEAMDAEALAAALIPDPPTVFGQSGADFFFRQSARTLRSGASRSGSSLTSCRCSSARANSRRWRCVGGKRGLCAVLGFQAITNCAQSMARSRPRRSPPHRSRRRQEGPAREWFQVSTPAGPSGTVTHRSRNGDMDLFGHHVRKSEDVERALMKHHGNFFRGGEPSGDNVLAR